jgi:pilus assembly protein CpaF
MNDLAAVRARVQERLLAEQPSVLNVASRWERRVRVREAVARLLGEEDLSVAPAELGTLVRDVADSIVGLGPLEPLLHDPTITEVMVNGPSTVYVERAGRIERAAVTLEDDAAVIHLIDRIVGPLGLRADESSPWVDARLPDGSRVHAILPPLAVGGPTLTIRRFSAVPMTTDDLVARRSLATDQAAVLIEAVRARRSIMVSGGAGAGKTTLLGALAAHIDPVERIITIEDAAELRLQREHVVALETRPANVEGRGRVTVRDLVRNALRMRPDRIIVGEVRSPRDASALLEALSTGHAGSLTTLHAGSARDALGRLELLLARAGELSSSAIVRHVARAIDVIAHLDRRPDGRRIVREIARVEDELATIVWSYDR